MRKIAQFGKYIRSLAIPPWTSFTVYIYISYIAVDVHTHWWWSMRRKHDGMLKTREMASDSPTYFLKKWFQFRISPSVKGVQGSLPHGHAILVLCPWRYPRALQQYVYCRGRTGVSRELPILGSSHPYVLLSDKRYVRQINLLGVRTSRTSRGREREREREKLLMSCGLRTFP
jgi:hypothetical protein